MTTFSGNIAQPPKVCPFRASRTIENQACRTNCALYVDGIGCILNVNQDGNGDCIGKFCPIRNSECNEQCGMFNHGCSLAAIAQNINEKG